MKARIYRYTFEIVEENNGDNVFTNSEEGTMRLGLTDYVSQKIYIHRDLSLELKRRTLAHELSHAFLFGYGLDSRGLDNELVCNFVANCYDDITRIVNEYMEEIYG